MRPSPTHFSREILFALIMISKKKNEGAEDFSLALSYYYKVLVVTTNLWSLISVGHRINVGYVNVCLRKAISWKKINLSCGINGGVGRKFSTWICLLLFDI